MEKHFNGFGPETIKFLQTLARHTNDKSWFEGHRQQYEQYLLQPLRSLVVDMTDFMLDIDPCFEVAPVVNKTISRIYRDTRFSRDKSLFKKNMWIVFKRPSKNWKDDPGYFFEVSANWYRYGMGFYRASADTMRKFREMIDEEPDEFLKAVCFYPNQRRFVLLGDKYKRILDTSKSDKIQNWYQRKNLCLICTRKINKRLFSSRLVEDLKSGFGMVGPFYNYLRRVKLSLADEQAGRVLSTWQEPDI